MKNKLRKLTLGVGLGVVAIAALPQVSAQVQPDAGRLLDTIKAPPQDAPRGTPRLDVQPEVRPAMREGDVKVRVTGFRITGNTVFSQEALLPLVSSFSGRELGLAGLDEAAAAIGDYYRSQGYFVARAYLPAQDVSSGVIEIAVIEGRLGKVTVQGATGQRIAATQAENVLTTAAKTGEPIREESVERGLMLLNDLPGVEVRSTLVPGATPGTSDLVVETTERPLVSGNVDIDNYGNKFAGDVRYGATLNLNSPLHRGDFFTARVMTSGEGMDYGRVAYILPIGSAGTKLGGAYSSMNYKLGQNFAVLNAKGNADVSSLFVTHPFVRSRNTNVYGSVGYDSKRLEDEQLGIKSQDKRINVINAGFSGDRRDGLGGGGIFTWSVAASAGDLDLSRVPVALAFDTATAQTNGNYNKVNYSLSRLQRVDNRWSLYGSLAGQFASKNLDSSEKFVLGGLGVRAYPVSEAAADEGYVLNLEARYDVPGVNVGNLQVLGFVDHGGVTLHKTTWAGWQPAGLPGYPNTYSLSGGGVGLNYYKSGDFFIRGSYAWKIGKNPGRDASNNDSDNASHSGRFWLQASKFF